MNDKEIMLCLRRLKDEGIPFRKIAEQCDIPTQRFYRFTYRRNFPLLERKQIEIFLFTNFKDIVMDECFSK